jgi:hypothetical protein
VSLHALQGLLLILFSLHVRLYVPHHSMHLYQIRLAFKAAHTATLPIQVQDIVFSNAFIHLTFMLIILLNHVKPLAAIINSDTDLQLKVSDYAYLNALMDIFQIQQL